MDKEEIISSLKIDKVWDEGSKSQEMILDEVIEGLSDDTPDKKSYKEMKELITSSEYRAVFYDACIQELKGSMSESDLELLVKFHKINTSFNEALMKASITVLDCVEAKVGLVSLN